MPKNTDLKRPTLKYSTLNILEHVEEEIMRFMKKNKVALDIEHSVLLQKKRN